MNYRIYTVYDVVADEAGPLFNAKNDGVAMRQFLDLLNKVVTKDDYRLYCLGEYDSVDMCINPVDKYVVPMSLKVEEV